MIDDEKLEKLLNSLEKQKESIWSIDSKWRGLFYWILSIFGSSAIVFTLAKKRCESLVEIFDAGWNSIAGSVVFVWFIFHLMESVMGAYQYFQGLKAERLQKVAEDARKEERERTLKMIEDVKKKVGTKASAAKVFQAMESACSYSRDNK